MSMGADPGLSRAGADMLTTHGRPGPVGRSLHHERFDGTGYPPASEEMPSRNWQGSPPCRTSTTP